jgi:spermidine/putrescine-binding protein
MEQLTRTLLAGRIGRREFVERALGLGTSVATIAALLGACGGRDGAPAEEGAPGPIEGELAIYNWSDYVAPNTIPDFEREFGVEVTYDVYESNEEMLAKLLAGASGYDLVFPTGYAIEVLVAVNLAAPLHRALLTNWGNLAPLFLGRAFDPDNRYSVPYQWGVSGYAYRTDRISPRPESWAIFHDPRYAGKMTQLDDGREVLGAWLRYRGRSLNSVDPGELEAAKADAIAAKRYLEAYVSAPVKGQLISGDVWVAQLWNGDAAQAALEQPNIGYVVPREGCAIWEDSLLIPRGAKHKRAAHEFMNYVLRPEVGAAISDSTGYGTPNERALPLVRHPVPYPTDDELRRLEFQTDIGRATALVDQIWTEIKSA